METLPRKVNPFGGILRGCLPWIFGFLGLALGLGVWFALRFPEAPAGTSPSLPPLPYRFALAFGADLIGAVPGILALMGFDGVRTRMRERSALLRAAGPKVPIDGAYQPFFGRVGSERPSLVAPLSGRECLLYSYEATESAGRGSTVKAVEGFAMTPSHLDTVNGRVCLMAYMELDFKADSLDADPARERLRAYLPTADLFKPSLDLGRTLAETQKHVLDDDGSIRYDTGLPDAAETATWFHERVVQDGDEVAVFGMYSARRQAIVPDPAAEIPHRARLRKGSLPRLARGFVGQAVASGLVGLLFAAGLGFWIWLFFRHAWSF